MLRPGTLEEARVATEAFFEHYHQQRPHQGRTCGNQPPAVAHPTLPTRPALPSTVDPDRWLAALDGRCYPRLVKRDGCVQVDGMSYYVKQALAGQQVLLRLMASTRSFDVLRGEQVIKSLPIKGLCGKELPLEAYLDLMQERARSEERARVLREKRARLRAQHDA